jgi:hypothetical protein
MIEAELPCATDEGKFNRECSWEGNGALHTSRW